MMSKLIGLDVGTSGMKAIAVNGDGRVLASCSREYPLSTPRPQWSEQDPEDWWRAAQECLTEVGAAQADAIGLTGQMHGAVFLDQRSEVIRPAILWNDQRTAAECQQILATVGPEQYMKITCNPPLTGFQLPKIVWLRNREPDSFARVRHVLLPKDFIRFQMTRQMVTDVTDASGTGNFDVPARCWSAEIVSALNLPQSIFPDVAESAVVVASWNGVPVVAGGGDQAAGAIGVGAIIPGVVSVSLGTSGVVFAALDTPAYDSRGRTHTFCHANGRWHTMSVMLSCGGAIRWSRDLLYPGQGYGQMNSDAASAPPGSNGVIFLPFLTGERSPYNNPLLKAGFVGAQLVTTRSDLARAVFEGAAFGLLDGAHVLAEQGVRWTELRVLGGGTNSDLWVQVLADVFQARCVVPASDEGPALGAAILAGVGIGVWPNLEVACKLWNEPTKVVEPSDADYTMALARYQRLVASVEPWCSEDAS